MRPDPSQTVAHIILRMLSENVFRQVSNGTIDRKRTFFGNDLMTQIFIIMYLFEMASVKRAMGNFICTVYILQRLLKISHNFYIVLSRKS